MEQQQTRRVISLVPEEYDFLREMADSNRRTLQAEVGLIIRAAYDNWKAEEARQDVAAEAERTAQAMKDKAWKEGRA